VQPAAVVAAFEDAIASIGVGRALSTDTTAQSDRGLSVVVPAHNAEDTLGEQLHALLSQDWTPGFEVLVVDNVSADGTAELVRGRAQTDGRLRLVEAANGRNAAAARNAGVAAARFESIAFCDADDVVSEAWVKAMGHALEDHSLVAGRVNVRTLNSPSLAEARGLAVGEGPGQFGPVPFAHGCNIGVRRALLVSVGGWDDTVATGEDIELCLRLWRHGVKLHYEPAAEIHYRYRASESASWRQAVRYGAAHVDLARRLEVRQLPVPSRFQGFRNLAWLVRHCSDLTDERRRAHWIWTAGLSAGHLQGSARWATMYL
jgi:cellulose synthase/poly-beta-1,6-N-acetylglucosamine synthase-like glycosyltransferase